jgi:hypothetical protein
MGHKPLVARETCPQLLFLFARFRRWKSIRSVRREANDDLVIKPPSGERLSVDANQATRDCDLVESPPPRECHLWEAPGEQQLNISRDLDAAARQTHEDVRDVVFEAPMGLKTAVDMRLHHRGHLDHVLVAVERRLPMASVLVRE